MVFQLLLLFPESSNTACFLLKKKTTCTLVGNIMLSELILFPFSPYIFTSGNFGIEHEIVTEKDLDHLIQLLDGKMGDTAWQNQMERTTSNMLYQAWRYEPEVHYSSLVPLWFLFTIIFLEPIGYLF